MKINEINNGDLIDLPFATDLDEEVERRISDEFPIEEELEENGWIIYISMARDDLDYVMYKNIDRDTNRGDYRFLKIDKATGSWQMQRSKHNNDMATESGDVAELIHVIRGITNSIGLAEDGNYLSDTIAVGNTVMIMTYDLMSNRRIPQEVKIVAYVKQPGARPAVRYKGQNGKEKSMAANVFKKRMEEAQNGR